MDQLKTEIAHFVDCIQNGIECLTDAKHAIKVVKILSTF
jgi:predicted dehydrogenase